MVWKTRYSVRRPIHMIQPRRMSRWDWKLGSVKTTATACKRVSRDGMIGHTGGDSWCLGAVSTDTVSPSSIQKFSLRPLPESAKVQVPTPGKYRDECEPRRRPLRPPWVDPAALPSGRDRQALALRA